MNLDVDIWGPRLAAIAIFTFSPVSQCAEFEAEPGRYWAVYATVHYASFDGLGDVEPAGRGGLFETSGPGIELGGYVSLAEWGSATLLSGMEFGFLGFNSDVFLEGSGSARAESKFEVNYWTVSAALRFGESGKRYINIDAGLGMYWGHTLYIDCAVIQTCFRADATSQPVGGYLGISGSVGYVIKLGARMHAVHFDPIEAIGPGTGSLGGPIYTAFVGWEFGRYRD